jgi:hypothetical protein
MISVWFRVFKFLFCIIAKIKLTGEAWGLGTEPWWGWCGLGRIAIVLIIEIALNNFYRR